MKQLAVFLALAAAACSTTAVDLPYSPVVPPVARGVPTIATVTAADARDEKDPTYIGAVRDAAGHAIDGDSVDVSRSSGYVFGARVSDLNALGQRTMSEAIDQLLDKPGFLATVKLGS